MTMEQSGGGALARRATVEELVLRRNKALQLYSAAHTAIMACSGALDLARQGHANISPGENRFNYLTTREKEEFTSSIPVQPYEDYMRIATRLVDTDAWSYIIQITDLERLMDKTEKQKLRQDLIENPPEVTVENVFATLERVILDADTIFKRGIATCFSKLDRRFKTHDGWKIGSRIILDHAFTEYGSWCYGRAHEDTIIDIERVFRILDGKPDGCAILAKIRAERSWGVAQSEHETEYFKVRIFKNGNCHIWFKRPDLVAKVNQLIGEHYGNPIPEERGAWEDPFANPKTEIAKNFGFYPTPDELTETVFENISLIQPKDKPRLRILEPEAGTGQLARRAALFGERDSENRQRPWAKDYRFDPIVDCIEIQADFCANLRAEGIYGKVIQADFLAVDPSTLEPYDHIIMNPPFDRERDIDHIIHAFKFLKPGGQLTAIMSAGTEFRETKKSIAFRELVHKMNGGSQYGRTPFKDLPPGSFSSVGTNVNTILLQVRKPHA